MLAAGLQRCSQTAHRPGAACPVRAFRTRARPELERITDRDPGRSVHATPVTKHIPAVATEDPRPMGPPSPTAPAAR